MFDVENAFAGNFRAHRDRRSETVELEMRHGVGVGGEEDLTAREDRQAGEVCVEILTAWKAVDLDRDSGLGTG